MNDMLEMLHICHATRRTGPGTGQTALWVKHAGEPLHFRLLLDDGGPQGIREGTLPQWNKVGVLFVKDDHPFKMVILTPDETLPVREDGFDGMEIRYDQFYIKGRFREGDATVVGPNDDYSKQAALDVAWEMFVPE